MSGATWYQIYINRDGAYHWHKWIEGSTTWTPTWDMQGYPGSYEWWVQTWGPDGYGPWSDGLSFTVEGQAAPGKPSLSSPSGTITSATPTFSWQTVTNATWYQVYIDRDGAYHYHKWIEGSTTWTPTWDMQGYPGSYEWWGRAWGPGGYGPWSSSLTFTIAEAEAEVPGATTVRSPGETVAAEGVSFTWDAVDGATWYHFWLNKDGTAYDHMWLEGETTTMIPLMYGSYEWWVRTWGGGGYGAWSSSLTFIVTEIIDSQLSPLGTVNTTRPFFEWGRVDGFTKYDIWVEGDDGSILSEWVEEEGVGVFSYSVWSPAVDLAPGAYRWRVRGGNGKGEDAGAWSAEARFVIQEGSTPPPNIEGQWTGTTFASTQSPPTEGDPDTTDYAVRISQQGSLIRLIDEDNGLVVLGAIEGNRFEASWHGHTAYHHVAGTVSVSGDRIDGTWSDGDRASATNGEFQLTLRELVIADIPKLLR